MTTTPFEPEGYERRVDATKAQMREAGLETLFVTDPANMNYLTGYDG